LYSGHLDTSICVMVHAVLNLKTKKYFWMEASAPDVIERQYRDMDHGHDQKSTTGYGLQCNGTIYVQWY